MSVTISCDLRTALAAVRNQGRRPTCLAFAASVVHSQAHAYAGDFCVEWLYYHAVTRVGDGPQAGSTVEDTRAVIAQAGQPEEAFWPYEMTDPDPNNWVPPPGSPNDLWNSQSALCGAELPAIRAHLDQGRSVVLALRITAVFHDGWDFVDGEAVLRDDAVPVDPKQDYDHALVAVGHGRVAGERYLLIRNSWGTRWGRDGHAWIKESYVERRLLDAFVMS